MKINREYRFTLKKLTKFLTENDDKNRTWTGNQQIITDYAHPEIWLQASNGKETHTLTFDNRTNKFIDENKFSLNRWQYAAIQVFLYTNPLIRTADTDNVAIIAKYNRDGTVDVLRKVNAIDDGIVDKHVSLANVLANPLYHFTDEIFAIFNVQGFLNLQGYDGDNCDMLDLR